MTLILTVMTAGTLFGLGVMYERENKRIVKGVLLGLIVMVVISFGFNLTQTFASSFTIEEVGDSNIASQCNTVYDGGWDAYKENEGIKTFWDTKCLEFEERDSERGEQGLPTGEAGAIYEEEQRAKANNESDEE